jgi:hypothetical protein
MFCSSLAMGFESQKKPFAKQAWSSYKSSDSYEGKVDRYNENKFRNDPTVLISSSNNKSQYYKEVIKPVVEDTQTDELQVTSYIEDEETGYTAPVKCSVDEGTIICNW